MTVDVHRYLARFEEALDLGHAERARETCRQVFAFQEVEDLPYVYADSSPGAGTDWPSYPYNDAFVDPAKMFLNELRAPFLHHQLRDYRPLNIRCDYGTVILPSIFGLGYRMMENNVRPWAHHLESREQVEALISRGVPDLRHGLGGRCFDTAAYYREVLAGYPKLSQAISIYHPDLQGPFDVAHLIWGPDILYALYDCPAMVHDLLNLVTQTYRAWMRAWKAWVGEGNDFTTHWGFYTKGGVMIRDDTPVMLARRHYEEFVKPYDQELLDEFGGCIHFCGRGDAFVPSLLQSPRLYGIHCSQPELNDVDTLIREALARRVAVLGLPEGYIPPGCRTGFIGLRNA